MALATIDAWPGIPSLVGVHQFLQQHSPDLVQRGAQGEFQGLEIEMPDPLLISEGPRQEAVDFLCDVLPERCREVFFTTLPASAGRRSQISSLIPGVVRLRHESD